MRKNRILRIGCVTNNCYVTEPKYFAVASSQTLLLYEDRSLSLYRVLVVIAIHLRLGQNNCFSVHSRIKSLLTLIYPKHSMKFAALLREFTLILIFCVLLAN